MSEKKEKCDGVGSFTFSTKRTPVRLLQLLCRICNALKAYIDILTVCCALEVDIGFPV